MTKTRHRARLGLMLVQTLDVLAVIGLFISVREYVTFGQLIRLSTFSRVQFTLGHFIALLFMGLLWNRILFAAGLYRFKITDSWSHCLARIGIGTTVGVAVVLFAADMMGMSSIRGPFPLTFWLTTEVVFYSYRCGVILALHLLLIQKQHRFNLVVVGINPRSVALVEKLNRPEYGYHVLGFVDQPSRHLDYPHALPKPFLCSLEHFDRYLAQQPVDEVLVALPIRSFYDTIRRVIDRCATQGVKAHLATDLFDFSNRIPFSIEKGALGPIIDYDLARHDGVQLDLKRIFDLVVSSCALVILSPLLLCIALAVFWDSGRPVFFLQERIGFNKRRFKMFKFRTMVQGAEMMQAELESRNEVSGAAFKISDDPRVTRLGRWLRRFSLDELPQLANVLLGTMSFVGPRPLPVRDFERFYNDEHRRRFSVKPGMTGLWQVSKRDEIDFEEWMRLDLQYIDSWHLLLDVSIMIRTVPAVIGGNGAK